MPEEIQTKINNMEQQLIELKTLVDSMQNYYSLPPDFKKMIGLDVIATSAKSASSENQVVVESGAASYSVLKPPDGFDKKTVGGVVHNYPWYTS